MAQTPMWRRYLRFFGSNISADVHDELSFHLQAAVDDLIAQGLSPENALIEARRRFGNSTAVLQDCEAIAKRKESRDAWTFGFAALMQDLRYGWAQVRKSSGSAFLAALTLGIGVGIVTAVFSIVYAVLLRPLPFAQPDRIVSLWSVQHGVEDVVTPWNFSAWRRGARSFSEMAASEQTTFTLSQAGAPKQVAAAFVSQHYFDIFRVDPKLGRVFTPGEDIAPRLHLAVVSESLWHGQFHSDPAIIGRRIDLNREPFTIIGVMSAALSLEPGAPDVWVPLALSGAEMKWTGGILKVVGRLAPGSSLKTAQAEMDTLAPRLAALEPGGTRDRGIRVRSYASDLVSSVRNRLLILSVAVCFVLLIACTNVANLLLAQGAARNTELAIRSALGASRRRILRQLLTEGLLVGLGGAGIGLALAQFLVSIMIRLAPSSIPRLDQAGINATVLCFAIFVGLSAAVFAGMIPALRSAPVDLQSALRSGGRGVAGAGNEKARFLFISIEVASASVLLVSAGLLIRSGLEAQRLAPGFYPQNVVAGRTALPLAAYRSAPGLIQAYEQVLFSLRQDRGVASAALTSKVPLSMSTVGLALKPDSVEGALTHELATDLRYVSDDYLHALQVPLLAGREFSVHDDANSRQVLLVSNALAKQLWPHRQAVGQRIRIPELEGHEAEWEVVGVAADIKENGLIAPAPNVLYIPFRQVSIHPWRWIEQSLFLVIRTRGIANDVTSILQRSLTNVDPELPLGDVATMNERLRTSVATAQFYTLLLTVLGACGLVLTLAGIYGVVAYFVRRQQSELGIRLALGASRMDLVRVVLRSGLRPVLVGSVCGLLLTLISTRLLREQLFGVSNLDPLTLTTATVVLISCATLACLLPVRQAIHLDPAIVLRRD
jgi:predicted permease